MSETDEIPEWENCIGFMTFSSQETIANYKKTYQFKEKDGETLFPFYKQTIRPESILPSAVYYMYKHD
jgi:hypothetical protein